MIDAELEDKLDALFQTWQIKWTKATTDRANHEATAALNALIEVYTILGLETP